MDNYDLFKKQGPRKIPFYLKRSLYKYYLVIVKYSAIALISSGLFYTMIFFILDAPEEITITTASVFFIGLILFIIRETGKMKILKLLKEGIFVEGEIILFPDISDERLKVPTSIKIYYSYKDHMGNKWKDQTYIGLKQEHNQLKIGDPVPLCFHSKYPEKNIVLL